MGHVRRNNEDNFYLNGKYMALKQMDVGGVFTCEATGPQIYAVCDGMGGGEAGEEASCRVVTALADAVRTGGLHSDRDICDLMLAVSSDIHRKHAAVSGSTIALLALADKSVLIMNIGDSRVYRLRNGRFNQVSFDHVGYQAHSITQYLGQPEDEPLEPYLRQDDVLDWTIGPDDYTVYLLCSDGLTDMVPNSEIRAVLLREKDPKAAAQKLVEMALERGGKDNVTVMVVRVPQEMIVNPSARRVTFWLTMAQVVTGLGMVCSLAALILKLISG